ncbi:hypothetical protein MYO4S_00069 [Serratia phage 4S]|nr:hypothetical protein MYO4S_00069 [Serratia phage 4S]
MNMQKRVNSKHSQVRHSARTRNLKFNLTKEHIENLITQTHCAYSGKMFSASDPMTFERIDNAKGYIMGNVIPVKASLNHARGNLELSDIIQNLSFAEHHNKVRHLFYFDQIWAKHREEAKARVKKIQNWDKLIKAYEANVNHPDREKNLDLCRVRKEAVVRDLRRNFKYHKNDIWKRSALPVTMNKLRYLVNGMIRYTKLDACQRYNLIKGHPINKNL